MRGVLKVVVCGVALFAGRALGEGKGKLPFSVGKETTGIVGPLRADGTVDYVGALNEKYGKGVTAENNAFVGWLKVVGTGNEILPAGVKKEVLAKCGMTEAEGTGGMGWVGYRESLKESGASDEAVAEAIERFQQSTSNLWSVADNEGLADYLEKHKKCLDETKAAFARERWWMPVTPEDGRRLVNAKRPYSRVYEMSLLLGARATLRAKAGNFDGFLSDIAGIQGMARHLGSGLSSGERFCALLIEPVGHHAIAAAAGRKLFTRDQLARLHDHLDRIRPIARTADAIDEYERWSVLDMAAGLAMGSENLTGEDEPAEVFKDIDRAGVDWDVVLKGVNKQFDGFRDASKGKSIEEVDEAWKAISGALEKSREEMTDASGPREGDTREAYSQRVAVFLCHQFRAVGMAEQSWRGSVMAGEMVRAVVAAGEYRQVHGKWPEKLADLVPEFLKAVPKDIFSEDEKEVEYEVNEEGVVVRSVGRKVGGERAKWRAIEVGAR